MLILVFATFAVISGEIYAFPNDIERCRLSDERCLLKSANKVLKRYARGNTEINLLSLDPMYVDYVYGEQNAGIVTVRGSANDSYITGLSMGKIEYIGGFDAGLMQIRYKTPKFDVSGNYKAVAHVINLPINNGGKYRIALKDLDITVKSALAKFTSHGKEYFKLANTKISFTVGGGSVDVPGLGYVVNLFINASFDIIKSSLSDVASERFSEHFEKIFNEVISKNAIDELFVI